MLIKTSMMVYGTRIWIEIETPPKGWTDDHAVYLAKQVEEFLSRCVELAVPVFKANDPWTKAAAQGADT